LIVRQSDAHAWVEAFIEGRWMRIDPTSAVAPNRVERGLSEALVESERLELNTTRWLNTARFAALWEQLNFSYTKWVIGFDRDRQRALMRDLGLGDMNPLAAMGWMLIAVSLSGGFIALAWWLSQRHEKRPLDPSVQLWHQLRRRLSKAGLNIAPHDTVTDAIARASSVWPQHAKALNQFAAAYNNVRFSAHPAAINELKTLKTTLRTLPRATTLKGAATVHSGE